MDSGEKEGERSDRYAYDVVESSKEWDILD